MHTTKKSKDEKLVVTVDLLSNMLWNGSAQQKTFEQKKLKGFLQPTGTCNDKQINCKFAVYDTRKITQELQYSEYLERTVSVDVLTEIGHELNKFDAAIHDVVCSFYVGEKTVFTAKMIANMLSGPKNYKRTFSDKQLKLVSDSLYNMSKINVLIDATEETAFKYGKKNLDPYQYNGPLLPLEETVLHIGGKDVPAYHLIKEACPPMLAYATRKNQVRTSRFSNIQVGLPFTDENVTLVRYLYGELLAITSVSFKNRCHHMRVSRLISDVSRVSYINPKDSRRKRVFLDQVEKVLDYWEEIGLIKTSTWETEGNNIKRTIILELKEPVQNTGYKSKPKAGR